MLKHGRSGYRETLFHCEGDQALAQVAQRACGVSILEDIQKPSADGPGQLALGGPAWAAGLDQMASRGPFPASAAPWFYELQGSEVFDDRHEVRVEASY